MAQELPELASNGNRIATVVNIINDDGFMTLGNNYGDCYESSSAFTETALYTFMQKLIAEFTGTYLLFFAGFAAEVVNRKMNNVITSPGLAVMWGLDVMVMVYSVAHVSGAHFNPAVTIAFATSNRFEWKQVPAYVLVQMLASILASATVQMLLGRNQDQFLGTLPSSSDVQSLVLEFIITFYLVFAISGIATDHLAIREFSGLAAGATVTIMSLLAGPISGASMNPARSLGPAIVCGNYKSIWIYIVGPVAGAVAGAWFYDLIRSTDKPVKRRSHNDKMFSQKVDTFKFKYQEGKIVQFHVK